MATKAFAAFVGALGGILLSFAVIILVLRRRRSQQHKYQETPGDEIAGNKYENECDSDLSDEDDDEDDNDKYEFKEITII